MIRRLILAAAGILLFPVVAVSQSLPLGPGAPPAKYSNFGGNTAGASGNGADLNEDILPTCSFTMPINAMPNIGDAWQVTLGGKFAASTDSKAARVRYGTTNTGVPIIWSGSATTTSQTSWVVIIRYMKIGFNSQNILILANIGPNANAFSGTVIGPSSLQETLVNNFVVTGQNTTNSVASSVTCQYMQIEYFGAQ
jgi:hypothetical protein